MDHRFISLRVIIVFIFIAAIAQTGCRENTLINSKVAPANNAVGVWDTALSCITHTYYDDTVITSTNIGGLSVFQGVGAISDPFFGTMTGATYFQVIPATFNSSQYDSTTIDSAFLFMPYSGFTYGDTTNQSLTQTYQVFYLNDSLGYNSNYYSFDSKAIDAVTPLSDPTTVNLYHLKDTFSVNGVYYTKGMRIPLKLTALMNRINPAQAILTTSTAPATDFINLFNGICVRVANPLQSATAFPYFKLDGTTMYDEATILVYHHHPSYSPVDTMKEQYFFSTGTCAHFNNITKSYTHSPVSNLLHSTQANDSVIALQNQPGASIDIIIPGIKKIPAGVINKAELQLTLLPAYNSNSFLFYPEKLYPLGIANGTYPAGIGAGLAYNIADRYPLTSLSPLGVLDGYIHTFTRRGITVQTFTIDLPREVMASIAAKNDTIHLHINGTQDFYGAFHMVAGGGSYSDTLYRPKLIVVYSKLK